MRAGAAAGGYRSAHEHERSKMVSLPAAPARLVPVCQTLSYTVIERTISFANRLGAIAHTLSYEVSRLRMESVQVDR